LRQIVVQEEDNKGRRDTRSKTNYTKRARRHGRRRINPETERETASQKMMGRKREIRRRQTVLSSFSKPLCMFEAHGLISPTQRISIEEEKTMKRKGMTMPPAANK
jgi:hypothetical protein